MKVSLSTDTLSYQLGVRPALQARDMGSTPLPKVIAQLNKFMEGGNLYEWVAEPNVILNNESAKGDPQKDALVFYMLNHAVNIIRRKFHPLEPLPPAILKLLDRYHTEVVLRGTRMFYYLMLICVRESRHSSGPKTENIKKKLIAKYPAAFQFHEMVEAVGETAAVDKLKNAPPDIPLSLWVEFMSEHFRSYTYSSAFGGEKWGKIADVVRDFAIGKTSLELLLDTAFTLSHNTSPAFDKGMLYTHYSGDLLKILDVQNSGQIPQLVKQKEVGPANSPDVQVMFSKCVEALGEDFLPKPYVDWYKVEADYAALSDEKKKGHTASYPSEKKAQDLKFGKAKVAKPKSVLKQSYDHNPEVGEWYEKEVVAKGYDNLSPDGKPIELVQIFPGEFIMKVPREEVA